MGFSRKFSPQPYPMLNQQTLWYVVLGIEATQVRIELDFHNKPVGLSSKKTIGLTFKPTKVGVWPTKNGGFDQEKPGFDQKKCANFH